MAIYYTISITILSLIFIFFIYSIIVSIIENEKRASIIFSISSILSFFLIVLFIILENRVSSVVYIIFDIAFLLICLVLFVPFFSTKKPIRSEPLPVYDERDIVFSRYLLKEGTDRYEDYYSRRPEGKVIDDQFRTKPGLLNRNSIKFHLSSFYLADANFSAVEKFKKAVDGDVSTDRKQLDPASITKFIKELASKNGAHDTGITILHDYHKYNITGRGDDYGEKVKLDHKFAIAFAIEMDYNMIKTAPNGPVVAESSKIYLETGILAVQVAEFIRGLGYSARAHIDGNYKVICPLVARDAGLGEIGRMGILITPKLGPRVRLSVVTTEIDLIVDDRPLDNSVIEFCKICKKCADNCPTNAISYDDESKHNGVLKWQLNRDACFSFWTVNGTDCGRCISVCPYSHPNNLLHNFIRWGIRNNKVFRKLALKLDDVFYGRRPKIRPIPKWMNLEEVS